MALQFDTLAYARRLAKAGIPSPQAVAHAEAAREYVMAELVTKSDLKAALDAQSLKFALMLGAAAIATIGALAFIIKL